MKQLIGCCGLDCEQCGAYIATVNDDNEMREKTAKLWSEWNNCEIPPEAINCLGCRTDGVKAYYCSELCEIRKCALQKGFETCGECAGWENCQTLWAIHDHSEEAPQNLRQAGDHA